VGEREAARVRAAIAQTFAYRKTHPLPRRLPEPPASWVKAYAQMAEEDSLPWRTLTSVTEAARAFLDPVLGGDAQARWTLSRWSWE
jgi:hypothetical protein